MEILNYTGEAVGLTDQNGNPRRVLPSIGKAVVVSSDYERRKVEDLIPILIKKRGFIKYLPHDDGNLQRMFIVNREVAEAGRMTRRDLLVVEDMYTYQGGTFYRKLVNISEAGKYITLLNTLFNAT